MGTMTKDMVRAGNGTKATKKPTLAKVNGGEAGKTYGGKPAGGAAAKNASASSAFCPDYAELGALRKSSFGCFVGTEGNRYHTKGSTCNPFLGPAVGICTDANETFFLCW